MRATWQYILVASLLTVTYGQFETKNIRSISSGLSFGMCFGYCKSSINITSNPSELIASKEANFDQKSFPTIRRQFSFSLDQWEELVSLLNLQTFTSLPDTIGCPGCADGGIEWIQVDSTDGTKRVTFESRRAIKGLEGLTEKLRLMRQEYLNQIKT